MRILYLGACTPSSTSFHRANALIRLGHEVICEDPYKAVSSQLTNRWSGLFHYHTGYRFLQASLATWIKMVIRPLNGVDSVWVDSGELFGKKILLTLRSLKKPLILFNHDDPTGVRDGRRFASLKTALAQYDVVTAVRNETALELAKLGCKNVLRIWRTYDEVAHSNSGLIASDNLRYASDVCFIGTWMRHENRDQFLLHLASRGLNIAIWGDRWQKSPCWSQIQPYWRGHALSGHDYVAAMKGTRICLGLLSKGNRDLHTTRSMEIPFAGGLLCAERTVEHLQLYKEDEEAVFWADANECAEKCIDLLANDVKREHIRLAGMARVLNNKVGNEDICLQILLKAFP